MIKVWLTLLFISLCCPHYYTVDTVADPYFYGTQFTVDQHGDLHLYEVTDHYSGKCTLVMHDSGTADDVTDDVIFTVIERS